MGDSPPSLLEVDQLKGLINLEFKTKYLEIMESFILFKFRYFDAAIEAPSTELMLSLQRCRGCN